MHIIDNFIPKSYQEQIKNTLMGAGFPWYYTPDVTFGALTDTRAPAMAHLYRDQKETVSGFYSMIAPLVHIGCDLVGFTYTDVVQCRSFLQFPIVNSPQTDNLHIDLTYDHLVILYYVTDSTGDTIIVDKHRIGSTEEFDCKVEDYSIIQRVTPKQGRAVIFDGKYYHTAEQPTKDARCIINFDVI
jgi:hypothetical protein